MEPIRLYKTALMAGESFSGGVVATLMNYIRHVDRTRFRFTFYIGEEPSASGRAELEGMGIEIVVTPSKFNVLAYTWFLIRDFRKRHFDILHANLTALNLFPLFAGWLAGIPVRISHAHSTANPVERKATLAKNVLRFFSHAFVTDYFACTDMAGRWLFGRRLVDAGKLQVIRNAIDLKKFALDVAARESLRRDLKLEGKFIVGHAGRFVRQKNHVFTVEVFQHVAQHDPNAVLIFLGKGPLQESIRQQVETLGLADRVLFLGERNDVEKYYSVMDAFLFPTLFEGLGMVLVEAQANGLPCIASTEVPDDVKMTSLVELLPLSASPVEWASRCLSAHRDMSSTVQEKIRCRGYDITSAAHELEDAYRETVKRRKVS